MLSACVRVGDRRKSPVGTFPPKHLRCPHSLMAMPSVRTVAQIEVFFGVAKPHQKTVIKIARYAG